jgi:hypothetical protein
VCSIESRADETDGGGGVWAITSRAEQAEEEPRTLSSDNLDDLERTAEPTYLPTTDPSSKPSVVPSKIPSVPPSFKPSDLKSETPSEAPTFTFSPTGPCGNLSPEARSNLILEELSLVSGFADLTDASTAQSKAADWLINHDAARLCPDDETLLERYSVAVLYYSTGGDGWTYCSANATETSCPGGEERFLSGSSVGDSGSQESRGGTTKGGGGSGQDSGRGQGQGQRGQGERRLEQRRHADHA